ncbi:hypothetical protein LFYK43_16600 [Ligilactobacillus salitolerans]|uniref:Putative HNH nuclease YajD n=2 Tax=Ligilactobacillus salitolerans TaxID=1808352 RepID=A0A401IUI4_9LACO|nr:hypothetical protein LFYK43_16600 [Ligilactobacillus salitolerans]
MIPFDHRYCDVHAPLHKQYQVTSHKQKLVDYKQYNRTQRDDKANSFYRTKQWEQVRNYVVNRDMNMCQVCGNTVTNRKIVDHCIRLEYCRNPLDTANLNTLCYRCHGIKTRMEKRMVEQGKENILQHAKFSWWKKAINEKL